MRPVVAVCIALALCVSETTTAAVTTRPIAAEVYVKANGPATPLRGSLVRFDDTSFTLHVGGEDKTLHWTDVTPATAFLLRQKTIDKTQADQCFALGKFGWEIGAKDQAQAALRNAVRLDASLKDRADAVLATPCGSAVPATTQPVANANQLAAKPGAEKSPPSTTVKFEKATPDQIAAAMDHARRQSEQVQTALNLKLGEFETDHFIIFTDWPPNSYDYLKTNLERAYRVVATQFEADPKDTVFVGKLPVYMLAKYGDFENFAHQIDHFGDVNPRTAGYYQGNTEGVGHLAMWKPNQTLTGTSSQADAERLWAYVLTHEFTHAFLARYQSNVFVPRWLNEGIAEVIAYNQFPYADRRRMARLMALNKADVRFLFDNSYRPTGEYYPVMQSMVEMLIEADKAKFQKLIAQIKDGRDPEQALQEIYHANYDQFIVAWRDWAKNRRDN